ncbi:MAG: 4Fe-4S binding protein [Clostridiaceae bacterium]|nr:4Fe-4S binding protein [Clostridiaceae bacterium]
MKKKFDIRIVEKRCKQCGICVSFCPQKVLDIKLNSVPEEVNPDSCTGCKLCYQRCPDIAIFVEERREAK